VIVFYNVYLQALIKIWLLSQIRLQKTKLIIKNHLSSLYPTDLYKRYPPKAEKTSHKSTLIKAFIFNLLDTKGCKIAKTKEAKAILRKSFPNSSNNLFMKKYKHRRGCYAI